jgi:hypothetical protein
VPAGGAIAAAVVGGVGRVLDVVLVDAVVDDATGVVGRVTTRSV